MLEQIAEDYTCYLKIDVTNEYKNVQDVIDNMLTRLEELSSVLQIIKLKNNDCISTVSEDISKYRSEVTLLSKKIATVNKIFLTLQSNMDQLETHLEKAEADFGINQNNKLQNYLKPFFKKSKDITAAKTLTQEVNFNPLYFESVLDYFKNNE